MKYLHTKSTTLLVVLAILSYSVQGLSITKVE